MSTIFIIGLIVAVILFIVIGKLGKMAIKVFLRILLVILLIAAYFYFKK